MNKYILLLMAFFLVSCNFNGVYRNREEDKKDAEKITKEFYSLLKKDNRQEAFKLFGDKFFQVTSKEQLDQVMNNINTDCGKNIKNIELTGWETFVSVGTNPKSEYVLIYKVVRDVKKTREKITLQKNNDSIKIVGYNVNLIY